MNLDEQTEDNSTESFLSKLRNKRVIKPEILQDLGNIGGVDFAPPKTLINPSVKMQVRHNQVESLPI